MCTLSRLEGKIQPRHNKEGKKFDQKLPRKQKTASMYILAAVPLFTLVMDVAAPVGVNAAPSIIPEETFCMSFGVNPQCQSIVNEGSYSSLSSLGE